MSDILKSIRRTPYQSLASFLILFLTLFLSTCIITLVMFLYALLNYIETRPQIIVYFQTKVDENEVFKLRDSLKSSEKVLSVKYVSKDEAYKIYQESTKDNPLLLEMTSSDILPPSLEIQAKEPRYLPELVNYLRTQPGIDEVQFQKDIFDRLLTITNKLRQVAIVMFAYLLVTSLIVLTTLISFKIAMKKEEIEIMRLLGADNWFIRKPIINETIMIGMFGTIISLSAFSIVLYNFYIFFLSYFKGINQLSLDFGFAKLLLWPFNLYFFVTIFLITSLLALFISFFASLLATQKYLKK